MRPHNVIPHTLPTPAPTVLVVASGKGGTGVSLVSALVALAVAGEGWRVLLVDATERAGALHRMLGAAPAAAGADAADVDGRLLPVTETLTLLPAPADARTPAERAALRDALRGRHDGFDLVVLDAGARLEAVLTACGSDPSRLLLVAADDPVALAATHALLKAVTARVDVTAAEVVVNRCAGDGVAEIHAPLAEAAERFLDRRLALAGAIPHDPCLQGGLGAGMALQDAAAGSPCALAAREIGLHVMTDPLPALAGDARRLARSA